MKVKSDLLKEFLDKATLKKLIPTAILEFKEDGLHIAVHTAEIGMTVSKLNKEKFDGYEALGELGIKDMQRLIKMVERYSVVNLVKEGTFLKIVGETGSAYNVLTDKDFVNNYMPKTPNLEFDGSFKLDTKVLKRIKVAADDLGVDNIILSVNNNVLSLTVEEDSGDKVVEEVKVEYADTTCKYGVILKSMIDSMSGDVEVFMKKDYPLKIIERTDTYEVVYILAPMVKTEEDDLEEKSSE